ncbi:MAG: DNA polymerase III subunit epsilon [Rhizobiales bacterium]|nr:DNA polymerase III subunit epsilon [Hyphomicrobiales bacterium]MBO6699500.1 DNA polymerase III subunit epsilon [Hyphomicrobiales bacterium]MBO6737038.1 DNA polymerase III subunit epsilon [Hyphomicrobiales bacterium]MBO6911888.1 DNA polymerase III subunit epsilon [Hyphomicrobiales bacterium]MBO6954824.1 DNA polymerase III subunit epsilon [Hyphomicrobiales bacterium]
MRDIIFDVETTGLRAKDGDRVCEIAGIEMIDFVPTGVEFHEYVNPTIPMPAKAEEVHGLSDAFLADKPLFDAVADKWVDFIGDARLVAHNAMFDFGFVNAELERCGLATMSFERMIDTVAIARRKFPGSDNSLDALCKRFGIDLSAREKHNALLDTQLLAEVYVELIGARQKAMSFGDSERRQTIAATSVPPRPSPLPSRLTDDDRAAHAAFVATLGEDAVWSRYQDLLPVTDKS